MDQCWYFPICHVIPFHVSLNCCCPLQHPVFFQPSQYHHFNKEPVQKFDYYSVWQVEPGWVSQCYLIKKFNFSENLKVLEDYFKLTSCLNGFNWSCMNSRIIIFCDSASQTDITTFISLRGWPLARLCHQLSYSSELQQLFLWWKTPIFRLFLLKLEHFPSANCTETALCLKDCSTFAAVTRHPSNYQP